MILGVGGLGLVTWGATGGAVLAKASDHGCERDRCDAADIGVLTALRTASTISFYAGGGLALTGAALTLISLATGTGATKAAWLPIVAPGFVGLSGRF